ncbi:PPOX class probable F420-dependent enzyme [Streptomyces sp. AK010]|nr:PPOX class probable F420-dependent enzyme [Streptomyces sp. AK010]
MYGKLNGHIRERLLAPNFWHLATVGVDGAPQVSPMWADIEGEYVMVDTSMGRVKEENLRRNPYVSLSHHDPAHPYDRVEIRGKACGSWRGRSRSGRWTGWRGSTSVRTGTRGCCPASAG